MIDLHTHTTASDGLLSPEQLVERAWRTGVRTLSITDHDTMSAIDRASTAAHARDISLIPGIELTSVHEGRDVHILGYFLDQTVPGLQTMLGAQRAVRLERAKEIAHRLNDLGVPIDIDSLVASGANGGKTLARPALARALVAAGHVSSVSEAFDRFLGENSPAYVPHRGVSPAEVVRLIRQWGGLSSFAHPGHTRKDALIPELVDAGLVAIEAYQSAHTPDDEARYLQVAERYGLAVTGGSDFHGDGTRRAEAFGIIGLPPERFADFIDRRVNTGH